MRSISMSGLIFLAALPLGGCGRSSQPRLRVANVAPGTVVHFCIKAADAGVFLRVPGPTSGAWAYHPGDTSGPLRLEPGPKIVRVVREAERCRHVPTVVPDLTVNLAEGSATTLVLAEAPPTDQESPGLVLLRNGESAAQRPELAHTPRLLPWSPPDRVPEPVLRAR